MNRQTDGEEAEIVLAEDVWLGANVIVLKGVHIGRGVIVAPGRSSPTTFRSSILGRRPARRISVRSP